MKINNSEYLYSKMEGYGEIVFLPILAPLVIFFPYVLLMNFIPFYLNCIICIILTGLYWYVGLYFSLFHFIITNEELIIDYKFRKKRITINYANIESLSTVSVVKGSPLIKFIDIGYYENFEYKNLRIGIDTWHKKELENLLENQFKHLLGKHFKIKP